ncbi:MAG: acyl carrier protein [Ruminococcus sp.]|nr:acyl carrier protein [Oscillospiraceae bacterium]MBR2724574.1 acyl carrier protein [Ruminococcus sp.]
MVLEKVKVILAEQFDVDEDTITVETDIQEDLGADSLDVVDLLMSIEDEFEVEIPDEEIENIKTVGELVSFIEANA